MNPSSSTLLPPPGTRPARQLDSGDLLGILFPEGVPEGLPGALARHGGAAGMVGREGAEIGHLLELDPARARRLAAALELGRRALACGARLTEPLRGGRDVVRYLGPRMSGLRRECFHALHLDAKGRLLWEERVSEGTLTASLVHPREVFAPAILHRAAAVVVAHNHPSGDPEPSAEDRATTRRLQRAGRLLGIELLDHVIVGAGAYISFLEKGWL